MIFLKVKFVSRKKVILNSAPLKFNNELSQPTPNTFNFIAVLTISPFLNRGGSHETMIFVLDDGIALMLCGADGTAKDQETTSVCDINVNDSTN